MVNRVILCGEIIDVPKRTSGADKATRASIVVKVCKYGKQFVDIRCGAWGKVADYMLSKDFKKGMGVQIIGSIGAYGIPGQRSTIEVNVDSMIEVEWLTKALEKTPWE